MLTRRRCTLLPVCCSDSWIGRWSRASVCMTRRRSWMPVNWTGRIRKDGSSWRSTSCYFSTTFMGTPLPRFYTAHLLPLTGKFGELESLGNSRGVLHGVTENDERHNDRQWDSLGAPVYNRQLTRHLWEDSWTTTRQSLSELLDWLHGFPRLVVPSISVFTFPLFSFGFVW